MRTPARTRIAAAHALGQIGPGAREAVPALARALGVEGRKRLSEEQLPEKVEAARALGQIGPGAQGAVPALVGALGADHSVLREAAARALGQIGPGAQEAVPALVAATGGDSHAASPRGDVARLEAVRALGQIGPAAHGAVPALERLAASGDPAELRDAAAQAIKRIASP